jgi:hypothetical protein
LVPRTRTDSQFSAMPPAISSLANATASANAVALLTGKGATEAVLTMVRSPSDTVSARELGALELPER